VTLAYFQTIADTFAVSAIIFVTGSYDSIFTFLYLVVIIYTSMLLLQKGSLIIAAIACIQYGILIELEYYKIITPFSGDFYLSATMDETQIVYRIILLILACFAVAFLSGILALQLKGARQELKIAQEHLKRVEKMAAMDEMISGIAHEIKNPLASLSGSIQLLQEDVAAGSYEDKLMQIILRETSRLKNIVNDIRLFAKPRIDNAGETKLADLIEETVELFINDPEWNKKIHFNMDLNKDICVFIDPSHFLPPIGRRMGRIMAGKEGLGGFGVMLTEANIEDELVRQRGAFDAWVHDNERIYRLLRDTAESRSEQLFNSEIYDIIR